MNILSQLISTGGKELSSVKGKEPVGGSEPKKDAANTFSRLMMGFLGMNISPETPTPSGPGTSGNEEMPMGDQKQPEGENQTGQLNLGSPVADSPFDQLIAPNSHSAVTNEGASTGESNTGFNLTKHSAAGSNHQSLHLNSQISMNGQPAGKGEKAVEELPASHGQFNKVQGELTDDSSVTGKLERALGHPGQKSAILANAKSEGSTSGAVSGFNEHLTGKGKVAAETTGQEQSMPKKFPGISVAAVKNQEGLTLEEGPVLLSKFQELTGEKTTALFSGSERSRNVQGIKDGAGEQLKQANGSSAGKESSVDSKHPLMKELAKQEEENAKSLRSSMSKQATDDEGHSQAKKPAGGTGSSATLQNVAASMKDKHSAKPLSPSSSVPDLDAAKVFRVDSGVSDEMSMEMETDADKDFSSKEEGKTAVKLSNTSVSHLNKVSGRREFSSQMVRHLQQQSQGERAGSTNWSHHRFLLDDGEAVNVAVRQADGTMQLQLSGGSSEINKILQQHVEEIRQHLQEQMNIDIDLQFQQFGGQQNMQENENSQNTNQSIPNADRSGQVAGTEEKGSTGKMRYMGFNTNEWTA